ncbi:MAG TPA: glycosyltransferase family 39 protein, partial [Pirellulales bacterium]|nr:glycosyltransferase family 39 protein [Pirellulales bacterium]
MIASLGERRSKALLLVLGLALALRAATPLFALAVARERPLFREPDSFGYLRVAEQLANTGRFVADGAPEIVRTPGYPLLLTIGVLARHVDAVTIGIQIALSCFTVWLVFRTGSLCFTGRRVALLAAALLACEPLSVLYASKLLSETLFTTLTTLALWFAARYLRERRWLDVFAVAIAIAAAAYVRPIAYYLPFWLTGTTVLLLIRSLLPRRRLALQSGAFLLLAMSLMGLWQWRNDRAAGYSGFSAIADVNLYYYEAVPVLAELEGIAPERLAEFQHELGFHDRAVWLRRHPEQVDWSDARQYAAMRREAWRVLRAHPSIALRLHLSGIAHTLLDSGRNAWVHYFHLLPDGDAAAAGGLRPASERLAAALKNQPLVLAIHAALALALASYLGLALVGLASGLR